MLAATRADVVTAELGASAAFAGLVLVFLGVLVTSYQTSLGQTSIATLERFRRAAWLALGVFLVALASVAAGAAWLATDGGTALYDATLALFFAEIAALVAVAVYSTTRVLLR